MFTATFYVTEIIFNVSHLQYMLAERFGFHLEKKTSGGSWCILYEACNLSVLLQCLHQNITTSVCGSASCHVGSCVWTWVSNNLNRLSPALSMLRPKPAAWPKVTAAPYICPPALCPSPSALGTVGVGVCFGQGRTPGSTSKGGWRSCGGQMDSDGGFFLSGFSIKTAFRKNDPRFE